MEEYLIVGKIIDTHSLDGTLKILSSSTNQDIRYKAGNTLFIKDNNVIITLTVDKYRKSGNLDIVHFVELDTIEKASIYKGKELLAKKDTKDLKEGYYFYSDLVGCSVICEGKEIGKVSMVEEFPAQITLRVSTPNKKDIFVPFIKVFIKEVDIDKKQIEINYMEGLL